MKSANDSSAPRAGFLNVRAAEGRQSGLSRPISAAKRAEAVKRMSSAQKQK